MAMSSRRDRLRFWAILALMIVLAGCGSRQSRVVELNSSASGPDLQTLNCELQFQGVVDRRRSKRVGDPSLNFHEIANLIDYLDEQINTILRFGESGPELMVGVRHAYAEGKAMRGFYTVVLSVGTGNDTTISRGRHDVTNWVGSSNEFQRGIRVASHQALRRLHSFLAESEYCQPTA